MNNKTNCICRYLYKIDEFYSILEFEKFQKYISQLLKDGHLIEVPVKTKYAGFDEQWFECKECKQKWRLVHPDFPFKGFWDSLLRF